jgi:site-specific DNA-methyltransferase (adenine-specific)
MKTKNTPETVFEQLNKEFKFNLDAAADFKNRKCKLYFNEKDNAFSKNWNVLPQTIVWLNPPNGRNYKKWIQKAVKESDKCTVVCLLPATTEADWFKEYVFARAEVRFINKRLKFDGHLTGSTKGSMVVIFGRGIKPIFKIMEQEF